MVFRVSRRAGRSRGTRADDLGCGSPYRAGRYYGLRPTRLEEGPALERSVAQWAQAEPAARDVVLNLAERGVALQPAAETAIQLCRPDRPTATGLADGRWVAEAYLALGERLRSLDVGHPIGGVVAVLLDRHSRLVRLALEAVEPTASGGAGPGRGPPAGLGQAAGELVGVRDLLRRTVRIDDRPVTDLPAGGRL